ncbi:protein FAM166C A [Hypomesus transpacificus]|uniref:protein FAM166C A n=1 Tax=Hypomesus transpacificus TaxID=137520 RepID=UPI001F084E01|nr:protein FAM166C A [Hypomesus transpacificus]XP_046877233.1 protein FAM166C A [Hypomesus transpacificus]
MAQHGNMAHRGNGTLITHNNATYIPPSLMPGYCGHVPNIKNRYGDTFGNATIKYFQDFRSSTMSSSKSPYNRGGMFPSVYSNNGLLVSAHRAENREWALSMPYWARYNVDLNRHETIKNFGQLAQKHRENYRDKTGTRQGVTHFVIPVKDVEKYPRENILLLPTEQTSSTRRYQTFPSGIRTCLDDRCMRDVFYERR